MGRLAACPACVLSRRRVFRRVCLVIGFGETEKYAWPDRQAFILVELVRALRVVGTGAEAHVPTRAGFDHNLGPFPWNDDRTIVLCMRMRRSLEAAG